MDYTIIPSEDGNYIILKARGKITRKWAMQQNKEAHAIGKVKGINRYLVDMREAVNVDPVLESYKFAHQDMQDNSDIDQSAVVSLLVSPDDHSHDFIETVSRNAGLNVTKFTDEEKAIAHLVDQAN